MDELNKRNTLTVEQALKDMTNHILEQEKRIDGLVDTYSSALQRIEVLEKILMFQKAMLTGHGPSVK